MAIISKDKKYRWEFCNIGGSSRVKIRSGKDVAHLSELDPKMWTVLSCPVSGLEIDDKSLSYIDSDADGKIRVNDIISTAEWVTGILKNPDLILEGKDNIDIEQIAQTESGKKLYDSAKRILVNLSKEGTVISIADTADNAAIFAQTRFNGDGVIAESSSDDADEKAAIASAIAVMGGVADRSGAMGVDAGIITAFYKALSDYIQWRDSQPQLPFADKTDAVIQAYYALDAKVKDFFMRSRLAAFSPESITALDVQTSRIEAISSDDLVSKTDDIASYPLSRITGRPEIDLTVSVNPAWASSFETIRSIAFPENKTVTEEDWKELGSRVAEYVSWKSARPSVNVDTLGDAVIEELLAKNRKDALLELVSQDAALAEEAANIDMVDKFLHIYRDFYRLLRNFITLDDFYNKDKSVYAIFQSGRLIIDQRECRLCMKVSDMAKHNASAATSGMFLLYCDCTTKSSPQKLNIVAAVTVGEIGDLIVGKNAVYYDNAGLEWDAVITKVIENPISVAQAFWSPYRRMAKAIENLISKNAADKDAKMMANANAKINTAPASLPPAGADAKPAAAPPFDIAKFAGIFAAIGVAVGMIGTALSGLLKGLLALKWWQLFIVFVGIMLLISGPAMVMAWLKLRRRNIAPLLNANGWAVNAASKISIPFGETLTDMAKYPKMKLKDPYKKGLATWQKLLVSIVCLAVLFVALWLFNLLSFLNLPSPF